MSIDGCPCSAGINEDLAQGGVPVTINNQPKPNADVSQNQPRQERSQQNTSAMNNGWLSTVSGLSNLFIAAFTGILAIFTVRLWYVGRRQAQIFERQATILDTQAKTLDATLAANKIIERAYVTMSHRPPGAMIEITGYISVVVRIKNEGRTPARITDVLLKAWALPNGQHLPDNPDYTTSFTREPRQAFLVAGGQFDAAFNVSIEVDSETFRIGKGGTHMVHVLGYVDYIDWFGTRQRAGYARRYDPILDERSRYSSDERFAGRSNLVFVTQPRYNYDRERKQGEGQDWDARKDE